ncbi:MAG: condensation domain-containing protein [Kibdelosporangium sp.]
MARSGLLSFGQLSVWREVTSLPVEPGHRPNVTAIWPLPESATVFAVQRALRALAAKHGSLRTTYQSGPGQVEHSQLQEFPVSTSDCPESAVVAAELAAESFQLENSHSWRACVVTRASSLVFTNHHIVADASAHEILRRDLLLALADPTALQPDYSLIDFAEEQRSARMRAKYTASVQNWRPSLDEPTHVEWAGESTVLQASLRSSRLLPAAGAIAAQTGVSVPSVLLSAYARAAADLVPIDVVPLRIMSSNRFGARTAEYVTTMNQWTPFWLPVSDAGLADLARDVHVRTLKACRLGCYDPAAVADLRAARPPLQKYEEPVWGFNFVPARPSGNADPDGPVRFEEIANMWGHRFYLRAFEDGTLRFRAGGLSREQVTALLRRVHDVVLHAGSATAGTGLAETRPGRNKGEQ